MREPVIKLMIAERHDIGGEEIHDLNRGDAEELAVDEGALEHVAGDGVEDIFLLVPHLVYVAGEAGDAADQGFIYLLGEEVAVHVVGVEKRELC